MSRPNVLVLLTDQERAPMPYEDEALTRFRATQLPARQSLRARGCELARHYIASSACVPSRACLLTGHYPSLHGVTQTDGIAKRAHSASMRWLDPDLVPTVGDYFRAAGYRTFYTGKWHVSHADLPVPGAHRSVPSTEPDGAAIPEGVAMYERANRLSGFGFDGWIGPEPHGPEHRNSGIVRDPHYAHEAIARLDRLEAQGDGAPFLLVCSLVNPHDIVFFGLPWSMRAKVPHAGAEVPAIPAPPTAREDLRTKPSAQRAYARRYARMFLPQPSTSLYRRFYFALHAHVDRALGRILDRLASSRFADDTVVVLSSDHGELLGAHGGMKQKWHNAYEETLRVPCVIVPPRSEPVASRIESATSHIDLVPTLLGLAGIDEEAARRELERTHSEVHPLVGRDLSGAVRGERRLAEEPIYFVTHDEISEGEIQRSYLGVPFTPVPQPNHVEAIVATVRGRRLKCARYFSPQHHELEENGRSPRGALEEWELYDLDADPFEQRNLAHPRHAGSDTERLREEMAALLERARRERCREPRSASMRAEPVPPALGALRSLTRLLPRWP